MTGPLTTNPRNGGEPPRRATPAPDGDGGTALQRLVENLARVFDRLHPPDAPANGPFAGLSGRLRQVLAAQDSDNQSNEAILALKVLLHAVEGLRERLDYLDTASGHAYAQLNATEHKARELGQLVGRVWRMLASLPGMPADARARLLDDHASPESRLAVAEQACTALATSPAGPSAAGNEISRLRDLHEQELASIRQVAKQAAHGQGDLLQRVAELEATHQASEKAKAEQRHLEAELRAQLDATTAENQQLKQRLAERESDQRARSQSGESELRKLETVVQAQRSQTEAAASQSRQLQLRIGELENSLTTAGERAAAAQAEAERVRADATAVRSQAADLTGRLSGLERERENLRQQLERSERALNDLRGAAHTGDERSQSLVAKLAESEATIADLRNELERVTTRATALAAGITGLEAQARESEQRHATLQREHQALQDERFRLGDRVIALERELTTSGTARDAALRERSALAEQLANGSSLKDSLAELEHTRAALAQQLETVEEERLAAAREHATAIAAARTAAETAKRGQAKAQEATAEAHARAEEARNAVADLAEALHGALETLAASAGDDPTATEADHAARELGAAAVVLRGTDIDSLANRLGILAATRANAVQALKRVCEHLVAQAGETHGAREQAQEAAARMADLHRRVEAAAARATAAEADLAERTQALEDAEAARTATETARQELTAEAARWRDKADLAHAAAKEETGRLCERLAVVEQAKTNAELAVKDALSSHASASSEAKTAKAMLGSIGTLLGEALEATGSPETMAKAAAARLAQFDTELARAQQEGADLRRRLQAATETATKAATSGNDALRQAEDSIAKLELRARSAEERGQGLARDLELARDTARTHTNELAEAHQALAVATADLKQAQEQLADHQLRFEFALADASELPGVRNDLEASRAETLAAKEISTRLLDAVKELGHAANAAADRVGVGLPSGSRHLTRTTARIERALAGAEFEVAVESARSVCVRAAEQTQALASQVESERRTLHTLTDTLESTRGDLQNVQRERDAAHKRISELDGLPAELASISAERERLGQEFEQQREESARQLDELESRLRNARAETDEARARTETLAGDVADAEERLRLMRADSERERAVFETRLDEAVALHDAERAGAKEKDAALQAALEERDAQLARMRGELDKLRMRQTEVMGLEARIRTIDSKLGAANSEVARLRAEREADGDRLNAADDAESAHARMRAELDEAQRAVRDAEAALAEERARTNELGRQRTRLEREWKRRLAALEEELAEERNTAARAAADLSSLRGELAGIKTRGRRG